MKKNGRRSRRLVFQTSVFLLRGVNALISDRDIWSVFRWPSPGCKKSLALSRKRYFDYSGCCWPRHCRYRRIRHGISDTCKFCHQGGIHWLHNNDANKLQIRTMNIVSDRDNFVWKGHEALVPNKEAQSVQQPGFQVSSILQIHPPVGITALCCSTDLGLIGVGTAHGLVLYDYVRMKPVIAKCTLNPNGTFAYANSSVVPVGFLPSTGKFTCSYLKIPLYSRTRIIRKLV